MALAWLIVGLLCLLVVAYGLSEFPRGKVGWEIRPFELLKAILWSVCLCIIPLAGIRFVGTIAKWK